MFVYNVTLDSIF